MPSSAVQAAAALLDSIHWAQQPSFDEDDLDTMDELLERFHKMRDEGIFVEAQDYFNIPKLHSLLHYTALIQLHGTPDGYNTETTERLHPPYG